jgi:hypothetical protein
MRINCLLGSSVLALLLTSSMAWADGVCYLEMVSGHPTENCDADVPAQQRAAIFSAVQSCARQGLGVMTGSPVYSGADVSCVSKVSANSDPSGSAGSNGGSTGTIGGTSGSSSGSNSGSVGAGKGLAAKSGNSPSETIRSVLDRT